MRASLLGLALVLSLGCAPAAVDYGALQTAASARQRQAGVNAAATNEGLKALLARPLTADSAARVAVLNNQGARAAVEELGIAQAELTSVRRLPNPTAEAALRFGSEGGTQIELAGMIDLTELILALPRGGAASARVEAARLGAIGAILDLSFEARRAFFDYQTALQQLELRTTVMQALRGSAEVAQQLRAAGNITELDAANQQSIFEEARLNFQRAETGVARARERLNAIMGLWGQDVNWQAASRLPELPARELEVSKLESQAVARSLDLIVTKQRYAAAAKRANVATAAGWLPELKAGVSAEREDDAWGVGPAVELEVPLFYQGQGEVGVARAEMRREHGLYTDLAVRIRSRARELATRLTASRDAVVYYRDVLLPLKQRVLEETQLQYNAMAIGVFQLLQAKRDQVEAASTYIDRLSEYWTLRTTAEQLLSGRLGRESLDLGASVGMSGGPSAQVAGGH